MNSIRPKQPRVRPKLTRIYASRFFDAMPGAANPAARGRAWKFIIRSSAATAAKIPSRT